MQSRHLKHQYIAAALLLPIAGFLSAQEKQPAAAAKPKVTQAELLAKIARDSAEVRNAGQVTLSYADVVQKILPSVVSISTYARKGLARGGRNMPGLPDDLDQFPPQLREFFREYMEKQ